MEMEVVSEKANPVLKRKEIVVKIKGGGATPSRKDVVAGVASHFGVEDKLILVDQILTEFGTPEARARVKIYDDPQFIPKKRLGIVKARSKPAGQKVEENAKT
ncbi:MAG: 30S ribosomal protein S24e [Candidatus Aenigmarchaeota archaeon]|nr:30S ribosomal protein S24e [Candidatus Aenigmarchaeota archaeon]